MTSKCDRCGKVGQVTTTSRFNTDTICVGPGSCQEKERAHPKYPDAERIEREAVQRGDYNFPGIGKPSDL